MYTIIDQLNITIFILLQTNRIECGIGIEKVRIGSLRYSMVTMEIVIILLYLLIILIYCVD